MNPFDRLTDDDKRELAEALASLSANPRISGVIGYVAALIEAQRQREREDVDDVLRRTWPSLARSKGGSA